MFQRLGAAIALFAVLWCAPAFAQTHNGSYTVSSCGTAPNGFNPSGSSGYAAGGWYPSLIDINGNACVTLSSGGGTGFNVNLTGINGIAPGSANPLYVQFPSGFAPNSQNQLYVGAAWQNWAGVLDGTVYAGLVDFNTSSTAYSVFTAPIPCLAAASPSTVSAGTNPTVCDLNGRLWVNGSGVTQPISGSVTVTAADPCLGTIKLTADFESTSSGGNLITGTSGKITYICSIRVTVSTLTNFSLCEATSTACSGGTPAAVYLNTGTTAANGASLGASSTANGGLVDNGGGTTVAKTATTGQNVDVLFTTTNSPQVNVHVTYVQQ